MNKDDKVKERGSYILHYHCGNCGENFPQSFEFGQRASQGICPHCGVGPGRPRPRMIPEDFRY